MLTRFIQILKRYKTKRFTEWINVLFKNNSNEFEINEIDIFAFDNTLLIYSLKNELIDFVKFLIKNGADINIINNRETLVDACTYNKFEVVKYLVENDAETALAPRDRRSHIHLNDDYPLTCACRFGHLEIVKDGLSGLEIPSGSHI